MKQDKSRSSDQEARHCEHYLAVGRHTHQQWNVLKFPNGSTCGCQLLHERFSSVIPWDSI